LRAGAADIILVSENAIAQAMKRLWEVLKIVVEPSGATPYAALLEGKLPAHYRRVGIVLSGGNLDLTKIPWIEHPELLAPLEPVERAP
jgi:threonine dehydratase